jgi:hypothetical protein
MHILGREVHSDLSLTLALNASEWLISCACRYTPKGESRTHCMRWGWGVPVSVWTLWRREKNLPLLAFEPQIVRPVSYSVYQPRSPDSSMVWYTEDNIKSKNYMVINVLIRRRSEWYEEIRMIKFARQAFFIGWLLGVDTGRNHYLIQTIRRNYLSPSSGWLN